MIASLAASQMFYKPPPPAPRGPTPPLFGQNGNSKVQIRRFNTLKTSSAPSAVGGVCSSHVSGAAQ